MNERARVSCVFGILVQLRCFSVLFSTLLCFWSAVENIVSPEGGFTRSRADVHARYNRTLARVAIRAYKRRVRTVRRSGGGVIPWTHSNCVGGDVIRGSGQVNRMLRWMSECGEWRRWRVEM